MPWINFENSVYFHVINEVGRMFNYWQENIHFLISVLETDHSKQFIDNVVCHLFIVSRNT